MQKWEYAVYTINFVGGIEEYDGQNMNVLGEEGWELVAINWIDNSEGKAFFKRPKL